MVEENSFLSFLSFSLSLSLPRSYAQTLLVLLSRRGQGFAHLLDVLDDADAVVHLVG